MILADFQTQFQPLSSKHEAIIKKGEELLDSYSRGVVEHPTYTVIGTFGAGKTQFLFHLVAQALERGLVPLLFLAEDLFSEVLRSGKIFTQGDVAKLVEGKLEAAVTALRQKGKSRDEIGQSLKAILDPRGNNDQIIRELSARSIGRSIKKPRVLLLVDELEGQYRNLQQRVQTSGDRSPLRELFERRALFGSQYLKLFALAPAGIYEMGGADQTRVLRLVIPAADVLYIRGNLIPDPGRANACWWLSRGKARHLFKAASVITDAPANLTAPQVSRLIQHLDKIGQRPTEVPPAVTDKFPPSKLPSLLNLTPTPASSRRCYHIGLADLDEGQLAEHFSDSFGLDSDASVLLAEYFKTTALALSDENQQVFIPDDQLPDLLALSLDHLLEYEYGNPILVQHAEMLALYELFKSDPSAVYGNIGTLWDHKQSEKVLPLSVGEVRRVFPFPLMNPIVRGHDPTEMREKWEGKGLPLWKWSANGKTCWFFASSRDYVQFLEADEFVSTVLPDGAGVLCLFPPGEVPKDGSRLADWCRSCGKLNLEQIPQLLADFLLSGTGDLGERIPGDLGANMEVWVEDETDILLSRKARIYRDAVAEIVSGALPQPKRFCADAPPDADDVWGGSQVSDRALAVTCLSIAWAELDTEQKGVLAQLRDLFRSGKDGKGAGDLNRLTPRTGLIGIADDLLPRYSRARTITDSQVVQRIRNYWTEQERIQLASLARLVSLETFLKLSSDEDLQRILESFWRSIRHSFRFDRVRTLQDCVTTLESDILPVVQSAIMLEANAKDILGITGVDFEGEERVVKACGGFESLLAMMKSCLASPEGSGTDTQRTVLEIFASGLELAAGVRVLQAKCQTARRSLDRVGRTAEVLLRNIWEYSRATIFVETNEEEIKDFLARERSIGGTCALDELSKEADDVANVFEETNACLRRLEERLDEIGKAFETAASGVES